LSGSAGALIQVLNHVLLSSGWSIPYADDTIRRVYRQGGSGVRRYFQVNDDASIVGNPGGGGRDAKIIGFETMTAYNTGTGRWPSSIPTPPDSDYLLIRKSNAADPNARGWCAVADARTCWLFVQTGDFAGVSFGHMFGDTDSFVPNDPYRAAICAGYRLDIFNVPISSWLEQLGVYTSGTLGKYYARPGTGFHHGRTQNAAHNGSTVTGLPSLSNPADGYLYLSPAVFAEGDMGAGSVFVAGSVVTIRGRSRGLWMFHHQAPWPGIYDTFGGARELAGRTFLAVPGRFELFVVETSDTWDQRP
jgi:hypothetical protein